MVESSSPTRAGSEAGLDQVFGALADPTRRAILRRLTEGDASVGELAAPFDMTFAAVSKHLGVLERAGLLVRESRGRERRCYLDARPLAAAAHWTSQYRDFWEQRLDALEALLRDRAKKPRAPRRRTDSARGRKPSTRRTHR